MDNKNYFILLKVGKNQISIGDMIRVLEIFKNYKYEIVTSKNYNSFFKKFNGKNIITFSQFNNKKKQGQNIINLVFGEKKIKQFLMLIDIYQKKSIKFQLLIYLKNLINLRKKNKLNLVKRKKYKIGINWIVPQSWKIKSYPKKNGKK